jgi:ABC-type transport system involved in multi-copper enzyme maturation permease subunit
LRSWTGGLSRAYHVLYIDVSDVLRPPGLDVLVVLLAMLGAILVSIQPVTSPLVASRMALDPTLIATALFLAIRSSAGLAMLIQSGILSVYLTYPIHRVTVAVILLVSRVVIPSAIILATPLATTLILLGSTLYRGLDVILGMYLAFLLQSILYGSIFLLIAVMVKSQATSGILSVAAYFTYVALHLILTGIGGAMGSDVVRRIGEAMYLPDIAYYAYSNLDHEVWQLTLVPALTTLALVAYLAYMSRRFEVL